jgi:hypothetical protein
MKKITMFNDKKAIIRIVEAFVAVMIILSVALILVSKQKAEYSRSEEIVRLQNNILDFVKLDSPLRSQILINNSDGILSLISDIVPLWINYSVNICDAGKVCPNKYAASLQDKQVYANELLISTNKTYYPTNATRLVIYFWEK